VCNKRVLGVRVERIQGKKEKNFPGYVDKKIAVIEPENLNVGETEEISSMDIDPENQVLAIFKDKGHEAWEQYKEFRQNFAGTNMSAKYGVFATLLYLRMSLGFKFKLHYLATFNLELYGLMRAAIEDSHMLSSLVSWVPTISDMNILLECQDINKRNAMAFKLVTHTHLAYCRDHPTESSLHYKKAVIETAVKVYRVMPDDALDSIHNDIYENFTKKGFSRIFTIYEDRKKYMKNLMKNYKILLKEEFEGCKKPPTT